MADRQQITTHLPCPEEAFANGVEEKTATLREAFLGSGYSVFAGNVVICHIFTRLLSHAHRPMPGDRPDDPEFGPFWKRHRELDNMLSNAFMFMPERFRLPMNLREPTAVQANLNLHGAVICLHMAGREKADKFKLGGLGQASRARALTAAQEIIDIMKATNMANFGFKGPLMALSLYFAASVYTAQAKDSPDEFNKANLELIIGFMNSLGHQHIITRSYLRQLLLDIQRNNINVSLGSLADFGSSTVSHGHGVPLVARVSTSRHTKMQSPLPGRLPLGAPQGTIQRPDPIPFTVCSNFVGGSPALDETDGPASKRMRTSARAFGDGSAAKGVGNSTYYVPAVWSAQRRGQTFVDPAPDVFEYTGDGWSYSTKFMTTTLPHRTGSPAITTSRGMPMAPPPDFTGFVMSGSAPTQFQQMPPTGPPTGLGGLAGFGLNISPTTTTTTNTGAPSANHPQNLPDLDLFESLNEWDVTDPESFYAMLVDASVSDFANTSQEGLDPWAQLNSAAGGSSSAGGAGRGGTGGTGAWDTGGGGAGAGS